MKKTTNRSDLFHDAFSSPAHIHALLESEREDGERLKLSDADIEASLKALKGLESTTKHCSKNSFEYNERPTNRPKARLDLLPQEYYEARPVAVDTTPLPPEEIHTFFQSLKANVLHCK